MTNSRRSLLPVVAVWAIFIAYVLAARGIRNFFPISAFDMYQRQSPTIATRILVVDAAGASSEITQYDAFQCNPAQSKLENVQHCEGAAIRGPGYVVRDQQIYLDAHLRSGSIEGPEAKLVLRTFTLEDRPGPPTFSDCALAVCRVHKRGESP
jgi:hypothetical protein